MIDWLEIRQLAIAEHVAMEFGDAFTAVTGETGSGKSLVVGAVGILLGDRCENSLIRHGQHTAEVQGGFRLAQTPAAADYLRANGLDNGLDDERGCILRRVIRRDKPSRAFINGRAVAASQLRELGRALVDIHGQNEHHSLLHRKGQLALLDGAAGHAPTVAELGAEYERLTAVRDQIEQLSTRREFAQEKAELLQFQIAELEELNPADGEWEKLEAQQKRLHHAQDLAEGMRAVANRLHENDGPQENNSGMPSLGAALADCIGQLQRLQSYDARLGGVIAMLEEANVNLSEAAAQLQDFYAGNIQSPEEIAAVESRFSSYHELSRRHRVLPGLLAAKLDELKTEMEGLKNPEAELERLRAEWDAGKNKYDELAARISKKRRAAAKKLGAQVTELMQELGMAGGAFEIRLTPADADGISRTGVETAEFAVTANAGAPLQPMTRVASGGELSRISLAINVILAADAPAATLIFDEVDVGIGGRVAEIVGRKLRELGAHRQVICITHLAQVAACGHHQWSVAKQIPGQKTDAANVTVQELDREARIAEIARMTAGAELTAQSLAHAEQLLASV